MAAEEKPDPSSAEATVWRFLRAQYLGILWRGTPFTIEGTTEEHQNAVLEPYWRTIESDHETIMELVQLGVSQAATQWRTRLHAAPGVDSEMLDEALHYGLQPSESDD